MIWAIPPIGRCTGVVIIDLTPLASINSLMVRISLGSSSARSSKSVTNGMFVVRQRIYTDAFIITFRSHHNDVISFGHPWRSMKFSMTGSKAGRETLGAQAMSGSSNKAEILPKQSSACSNVAAISMRDTIDRRSQTSELSSFIANHPRSTRTTPRPPTPAGTATGCWRNPAALRCGSARARGRGSWRGRPSALSCGIARRWSWPAPGP